MFEQEDDCEFVFVWRTLAACPVHKAEGKCSYLSFKILNKYVEILNA